MKKPTPTAPTLKAVGGADMRPRADAEEFYRHLEIDVLARTLWGEARGEGSAGLEAVAAVVLNRVKVAQNHGGKYWWGANIIQVCQKPYQFSCWNRSDPSFQKLQAVDDKNLYFASALRVARRACLGAFKDPTGGATHYHADYVDPYWAKGEKPTAVIGRHIFYKLAEV
ncbi:MAG: cell wall hydrolase [Alphaproteobacteria bacterium]